MDTQISTTLIKNVRLYADGDLHDGAVAFCDGVITDIIFSDCKETEASRLKEIEASSATEIIDGEGAMLLPGAIDAHVHFREPGLTYKGDIASESLAAAAGGVTYVMDMPNCIPTTTTLEALREKAALFKEKCLVNYGLFFGITNDNIEEALSIPQDEICGYKVFLGSSTGGMLMNDAAKLRKLLTSTKRVIAVHSEDEDIIQQNMKRFSSDLPAEYHAKIRSREACVSSTKKILALATETGANLHICHISTADELRLLEAQGQKEIKFEDKKITAEACVGHLFFTDRDYTKLGSFIKTNPSIKTAEDREALRNGMRNGLIDTIATDHAPHSFEDKVGGALKVPSGMPSIQFSMIIVLDIAKKESIPISTVVKLMCENPAKRFGIKNRGKIAVGYAADLVLVANKPYSVKRSTYYSRPKRAESKVLFSKCGWSPYEGQHFAYSIKKTWVNGRLAFDQP